MSVTVSYSPKRRLYLAFSGIAASLLLALAAALLATDRVNNLLEATYSETLPRMLDGAHFSEQAALLVAALPVLVGSEDRELLAVRWRRIEESVDELRRHLSGSRPDALAGGAYLALIAEDLDGFAKSLDRLNQATLRRLDLIAAQRVELNRVRVLHAALSDTIAPVIYGVSSLSSLLARRDARTLSSSIRQLSVDYVNDWIALDRLHSDLRVWLDGELTEVGVPRGLIDRANRNFGGTPGQRCCGEVVAEIVRLASEEEIDRAELIALSDLLESTLSRARENWGEIRAQLDRQVRDSLSERVTETGKELSHAFDIKAEGNLLLALLSSTVEVDSLVSLTQQQARFNRSLAGFRAAADAFASGPLAQRNPILAENVSELASRFDDAGRQDGGLFDLRRQQLLLAVRIDELVAAARATAAELTQHTHQMVADLNSAASLARDAARVERDRMLLLLVGLCLSGLALSIMIAITTTRTLNQDAEALGRARQESERANRILAAVGFSARRLLHADVWEAAVTDVLGRLGEATDSSRVYILQRQEGGELFDHRYEWCAAGIEPTINDPELHGFDPSESGYADWLEALTAGRSFHGPVEELFGPRYGPLQHQGTCSILIAPIQVEHRLWGLLGFDDCHQPRHWADREVEVLDAAADTLGAAIAREHAARQLRQAAAVFDSTKEGVIITDAQALIIAVNPAFAEITGYSAEDVIGENPRLLSSGSQSTEFYADLWRNLTKHGQWQGEMLNRRKDGSFLPEWLSISTIRDATGQPVQYVGVFSDISVIKQSEVRLDYLAHHDALTALPNRLLLVDRLRLAVARARRNDTGFAVVFLDLDRFKYINDSMGHDVGDQLLKQVAQRLTDTVRVSDTVARLGGDEFVVVLDDIATTDRARLFADKLLLVLGERYRLKGQELFVSASLGISLYPEHGTEVDELIKNADAAMYQAKEAGKNTYSFYSTKLTAAAFARVSLESALRAAVEQGEFELHYQPQCSVSDGRIQVLEALVRWRRPNAATLLYPREFLPIAEESGLIVPIGQWVLESACQQCRQWRDSGFERIRIAVNLSAKQFDKGQVTTLVNRALDLSGLPGDALELELTESCAMRQPEAAIRTLSKLRELGVTLAIDDFGTGYSSLAYLKRLPFTTLKIDRSFVDDIPADANDMAISRAVVVLARTLQMSVVAEGVETMEQLAFLRGIGCGQAQGYLFSRALDPPTLTELMRASGGVLGPGSAALLNERCSASGPAGSTGMCRRASSG